MIKGLKICGISEPEILNYIAASNANGPQRNSPQY